MRPDRTFASHNFGQTKFVIHRKDSPKERAMKNPQEARIDKTEDHRIGDAIAMFSTEYKRDRVRFTNHIIRNPATAITRVNAHFREWDAAHVVSTEMAIVRTRLHKFEAALLVNGLSPSESLPLIALAAKNRAELISEKSDLFPILSAFIGIGLTVILLGTDSGPLRYPMGLSALLFVFLSATLREHTRKQVAYLKELANLAEHLGKHWDRRQVDADSGMQPDARNQETSVALR